MRRDVFQAISDPVRRDIIDLLSRNSLPVNAVAENFKISRPAVSKHLKILKECGIIEINKKGREQYCSVQPQSLVPAFLWMEHYKRQWGDKLDSFEQYLKKLQTKTNKDE